MKWPDPGCEGKDRGEALSRSDSKSNLGQNKAGPAKDQH